MILTTPPSKGVMSRKKKREVEEASPGKNLKEMAPMALVRWKTTAFKGNSVIRKLAEVLIEMKNATRPGTEEDSDTRRRMRRKAPSVDKCGK